LLTAARQPLPESHYHFEYRLSPAKVDIVASASAGPAPLSLILPVISHSEEKIEWMDWQSVRIAKPKGALLVRADAAHGFAAQPIERIFNLVPGFECLPLTITLQPGREVRVELSRDSK
jgi:hypothetical protein